MSFKIDKTISKVSGAKNYMNQLAQITGNIKTTNKEYYLSELKKIKASYDIVINDLKQYSEQSIVNLLKSFDKLFKEVRELNVYETKKKKSGKVVESLVITPTNLYQSNWFTKLRNHEAICNDLCKQFEITSSGKTDKQIKLCLDHNLVDSFTFYDIKVTEHDELFTTIYLGYKFINKMIEILLMPMYDVKKFIAEHWVDQIDSVVGAEIAKEKEKVANEEQTEVDNSPITRSEIQDYIYTFVVAKYKLELTGSSEQFIKILFDSMNKYDVANMNPARFANIIDNINLESIGDNKHLKEMAGLVSKEVKKLANKENITTDEILHDVNEFLNYGDKVEVEEKEVADEPDDVFV